MKLNDIVVYPLVFNFYKLSTKISVIFKCKNIGDSIIQPLLNSVTLRGNLPLYRLKSSDRFKNFDFEIYIERQERIEDEFKIKIIYIFNKIVYETVSKKISEDISKCILQLLAIKLTRKGIIIMHSAALMVECGQAVIIPGEGGTGKSTLSLLWLTKNYEIISSEITAVDSNSVLCGNTILSIKEDTVKHHLLSRFHFKPCKESNYLNFELPNLNPGLSPRICGIVFIKITEPNAMIKEFNISKDRAKMKLYESTYWIINGGFMLSHKVPGIPLAGYGDLKLVCEIINNLSIKNLFYIEGGAESIVNWITKKFKS